MLLEQSISRLTCVHSKAHSGKAPIYTSLNRQYLPDQSTSLLFQNCTNLVDAQTAFETAEAREQSSESAAANVAAVVWPDTIVRENTVARVERLAWLRCMAKSTQTSATSGEYVADRVDIYIYAGSASCTKQKCLLVVVLCLLICMCMLMSKSNFVDLSCVALGSTCLLAGTALPVFVTVQHLVCCCPGQQRRSSKRLHPLCSRLDLSMQLVEQLACRLL